ncbi:MAG: DUF5591 domain-containing protein, partial [Candidatus Aenigmarchaeota archaeon]|nr:DUF5591 domain-containing protein [Candidatus Aenigmarchaeota archaeon]
EYPPKSLHELKALIDEKLKKHYDIVKIFNSGSFLDEKQIPRAFRKYVVKKCEDHKVKTLVIESRGEYFNDDFFEDMKSDSVKVTIGIGLEVADDKILKKIKKGMTVKDYENSVKKLKKNGFGVRSYVLVNAPYSDQKTLDKTIKIALKYSDSICMMNWFPHGKSEAFNLWIKGKWKPFSEDDFIKATKKFKSRKIEKFYEEFIFTPRFPMEKQIWIRGAGKKELLHPYFEVWQDFIVRFYKPNKDRNILLFVPCAFRKPYSKSRLHRAITGTLRRVPNYEKIHEIVVSNPGVIPFELSNNYPFNKYDWPEWEETPAVKKLYLTVIQERTENYLKAHKKNYKKFYCYIKPGSESYKAVHAACKNQKVKLVDAIKEETYESIKNERNPMSLQNALTDLMNTLLG